MAKNKRDSIWRWKGLLGESERRIRIGMFALLAVLATSLAFTQLGLVGLGAPGSYIAYGNVLLAVMALGCVLFGIPLGTLLGFLAGTMMYVHAVIQPLDYYEIMYVTPLTSIVLMTMVAFLMGIFFTLALRRNPSLPKRIFRIIVICVVISAIYSIAFFVNILIAVFAQILAQIDAGAIEASDSAIQEAAFRNVGELGSMDITVWFNALLMAISCIIGDLLVRKAMQNHGQHSLIVIFRGWLIGIVFMVFLITAGASFVAITEQAKATAGQDMKSEIDYICNQLDVYDTRIEITLDYLRDQPEAQSDSDEYDERFSRAFSYESILEGYTVEADGTVIVLSDGVVILSNDERYPYGLSVSEIFDIGVDVTDQLDELAKSGELIQIVYDESALEEEQGSDNPASELGLNPIVTQAAYMSVGQVDGYHVIIIYPSSKVYGSRFSVMAWTTISIFVLLVVIFAFASYLLRRIVVRRINETNGVLSQITDGDLHARVDIRDTREFASLSTGINTTVDALRGWIAEAETRMEAELNTAKAIQASALPRTFPPYPDILKFDIYANMNPAREVGGDFYDFFLIGDDSDAQAGKLGFLIADVSGKGVPAALFMMTAKTLLRDYMQAGLDLGDAVENANRQLCEGNDEGMFVTAFAGILDYGTGHVTFVNAGHNPSLLWQEGSWRWLTEKSGLPLGLFDGFPYESFEVDCQIGDEFFLYTDGVTEAMNTADELYGEERLEALVRENFTLHPRQLITAVRRDVAQYTRGAVQSDDITMLSLEVGVPPEVTATLVVPADVAQLPHVLEFVHTELDHRLCPLKAQKQLDIALEELFVNVAHYAYPDATPDRPGMVRIGYVYSADPPSVLVEIADEGIPYDPLAKPDAVTPDDIMDVPIGGLGILMAKKSVDEMTYERRGNSNIVTLKKKW